MTKSKTTRRAYNRLASEWNDSTHTASQYEAILIAACEDSKSLLAHKLYYSLVSGDHDRILEIDINPSSYSDSVSYFRDQFLVTLVKKYPHWDTSVLPRVEAMKTFISCEMQCKKHNEFLLTPSREFREGAESEIILLAQRKIVSILGNVPQIHNLDFEFGPGAAFSVKKKTSAYDKLSGALDVTPEAVGPAVKLLQSCPGWLSLHGIAQSDHRRIYECLTVIPGDRLSFVPKTSKTDRPIAIGPTVNVLLQKGFGKLIRRRLKRASIDLDKGQLVHRQLARKGSVDGSLSTIDLKSASDTIGTATVMELLPYDWFDILDRIRSKWYTIEGEWYPYHKFSAMGNGFTFELETLIFYSLAFACCRYLGLDCSQVSVYGDDVIIPSSAYDTVTRIYRYFGFSVNEDKSFCSGPFRESCGGDYFDGYDVRGFYVKEELALRHLVLLHNYLVRTGWQHVFKKTLRYIRKANKWAITLLEGPDDGYDDHFIVTDRVITKYRYVEMKGTSRRYPRRFENVRVYLLYKASRFGVPQTFYGTTHPSLLSRGNAGIPYLELLAQFQASSSSLPGDNLVCKVRTRLV